MAVAVVDGCFCVFVSIYITATNSYYGEEHSLYAVDVENRRGAVHVLKSFNALAFTRQANNLFPSGMGVGRDYGVTLSPTPILYHKTHSSRKDTDRLVYKQ